MTNCPKVAKIAAVKAKRLLNTKLRCLKIMSYTRPNTTTCNQSTKIVWA